MASATAVGINPLSGGATQGVSAACRSTTARAKGAEPVTIIT
ncbi:hypothetical protein [Rhizobium sp. TRM95796]|nr:hypothetical protein [Rhizobium sp. TRM95796]MCV3766559.1 hypothetical protein [Rhizobium sp. TRM95796]